MKILVIRNDKLGDFVLSLPCFSLLKQALPQAQLSALVPRYTQPLAECFPHIDQVLLDEGSMWQLAQIIKQQRFDVVIVLFSTLRIALATLIAGVPKRLAPQTKLAQIFYRHTLTQRRSQSQQPEYQYNLALIDYFLKGENITSPSLSPPFWQLPTINTALDVIKQQNFKLVIIHPGSGGSAANLSSLQYADLVNYLAAVNKQLFFMVSGVQAEKDKIDDLLKRIDSANKQALIGLNLVDFMHHINGCDLFISGSTGPLHLAGILNKKTAAFYPHITAGNALRWQTLNEAHRRISFSPSSFGGDMDSIDLKAASATILKQLL